MRGQPPALLAGPVRLPLEQLVSRFRERPWKITTARDLADAASHPAAILSDGGYAVFAKLSAAANALEQFKIELDGLRLLTERAGVRTPTAVGVLGVPGGAVLVLEALEAVERGPRQWREIGQTLARLHRVRRERFGLETDNYFGPLAQDNRPLDDWATFYAERRLRPLLRLAIDSGHLPLAQARPVEKLIARLPGLCGPQVAPALLHGDAQQNNFISAASGAVVIDPAPYFGHPEIDLALVDYFQDVPPDVLDGYRDELPMDPGFAERRELWRVFAYLAVIAVDGSFVDRLSQAVQKYL